VQRLAAPARPGAAGRRDIGELCAQFASVCESAVDPLEISSALEFEGLNDQAVRERYGFADVFALGEELYRRVPRRPAEPQARPDPWRGNKFRPALHGLIYGLPTVCFRAATGPLAGPGVISVLVVALLTSWTISQGLSHLGYVRLGRADQAQAQRLLRAGLAAGMVVMVLAIGVTGLQTPARLPALIFGVGLGAYMLGAGVLLVLGAEQLVIIVLAPGVLGSTAFLVLGKPPQFSHAIWAALAATPLLALGLAAARTGGAPRLPGRGRHARRGPAAGPLFVMAEIRDALPSAGFGLAAAGLLVYPVAAGMPGHGGPNTGAMLASLPLALSMGAAESALIWYRRRTQRLLRSTRELRLFATRAGLVLATALLRYLAAAAVLTVVIAAAAAQTRLVLLSPAVLAEIAAYLPLGGAMFIALLLQAFGSRLVPVIACAVVLAVEVSCPGIGVFGQIAACTELLIVLAGYAALVLGRAIRHAC